MRPAIVAVSAALCLVTGVGSAQAPADSAASRARPSIGQVAKLKTQIALLRVTGTDSRIPPADSFAFGGRVIPAGTVVKGAVGAANGDIRVEGTIDGDAVVMDGNVVLAPGGVVTGDAIALGGRVILQGGRVDGEMRSLTALAGSVGRSTVAPLTTWEMVKLVVGWFAVLAVIGIGVLMFAEHNLDGVVFALERGFGRAFWMGVLGQIALLPALLLIVVGLALTILGVLLIPFAIVSYIIATAGVVTLGFLAVARLTGGALARARAVATPRAEHLRGLFIGLVLYTVLWLAAALFSFNPVAAATARGIAIAITWVAATAGFGAAIASRAGTQRPGVADRSRQPVTDELAWQTPTPVTGVAAARRPASSKTS